MKALVITNDPEAKESVSVSLSLRWPQITLSHCKNGAEGLQKAGNDCPDIVFLDRGLSDMDSYDVLAEIRTFSNVPVILVSNNGTETELVRGLELGADDYIVKPFRCLELMARIRAILRRTSSDEPLLPISLNQGTLMIDFRAQEVTLDGAQVKLTPTEYKLLALLASNIGRAVSHQELVEKVWGEEYLITPNVLKVHIHRLRRKLGGDNGHPDLIITAGCKGYKLNPPARSNPVTSYSALPNNELVSAVGA